MVQGGQVLLREVWLVNADREVTIPDAPLKPWPAAEPEPTQPEPEPEPEPAADKPVKRRKHRRRKPRTGKAKRKDPAVLGEGILDDF